MNIDYLGYLSAFLTTASFVPQVYRSWKTRDLAGISLPMYLLYSCGVAGWMTYGIFIDNYPMILANAVTFFLAGSVLLLKIKIIVKN